MQLPLSYHCCYHVGYSRNQVYSSFKSRRFRGRGVQRCELSSIPLGTSVNASWTQNCQMLCEVNINCSGTQPRACKREITHTQTDTFSYEARNRSPRTQRVRERKKLSKSYWIGVKCRMWTLDLMDWASWQLVVWEALENNSFVCEENGASEWQKKDWWLERDFSSPV